MSAPVITEPLSAWRSLGLALSRTGAGIGQERLDAGAFLTGERCLLNAFSLRDPRGFAGPWGAVTVPGGPGNTRDLARGHHGQSAGDEACDSIFPDRVCSRRAPRFLQVSPRARVRFSGGHQRRLSGPPDRLPFRQFQAQPLDHSHRR